MPELPEVESVRRLMRRVLLGQRIVEVEAADDELVLCGHSPEALQAALMGRMVTDIGRRGKYWWIAFEEAPWLLGHLGMAGWIRELGQPSVRLMEHGEAPFEDEQGRTRFLKLRLRAENGRELVFTDGRRFARAWLTDSVDQDDSIRKLGPDSYDSLPATDALYRDLLRRKAPIKAVLLDQGLFCGVGNYLADEALYQARLAPARAANTLTLEETERLRATLWRVLDQAIAVDADYDRFPDDWLFHVRWSKSKKDEPKIGGHAILRETIGGRTTAWVPEVQR